MMSRRRRDLMFDVLGGRSPAEGIGPDRESGRGERDAAAGAVVAVVLLVGVALGGIYWSVQDGEDTPDRAALSATRPPESPRSEPERRTPTPRRDVTTQSSPAAAASSSSSAMPPYAVLVRTIQWSDASKEQAAVDEVYRLVNWLKDEANLPAVRGVRIPGKNAYEVYVGAADNRDDLSSLEKKITKRLTYAGRALYFKDAFITNRPLDAAAARKNS